MSLGTVNTVWPVGEDLIRQSILDYVSTALPPIHEGLRVQEGISLPDPDAEIQDNDFPIFTRIDRSGPTRAGMGGDEFALLVLDVLPMSNFQTIDVDAFGEPIQLAQYRVRLYSFVKAGYKEVVGDQERNYGYARVVRLRSLTEASVRACLLTRPSLGIATGSMILNTLTAVPSDIQSVKGDRWVSGVYHEFIYQNEEGTVGTKIGDVETIDVEVTVEALT